MRMSVSEIRSEYGILKSTINSWVKDVKEIKPTSIIPPTTHNCHRKIWNTNQSKSGAIPPIMKAIMSHFPPKCIEFILGIINLFIFYPFIIFFID